MLELVLAYTFAASTTVVVVCLARQNRKQGWQRPAPTWFGVELGNREQGAPASPAFEAESDQLTPQLLQLNRALAAHGTTTRPEVESSATLEHVSSGRL
jgi:hypothetical protein